MSISKNMARDPWYFVPTSYFAEGLPYMLVNALAVIIYKKLGVSNTLIAFWTSWLYLPWVIKMLWGPMVDMYSTKRNWIIYTQGLMAVSVLLCAIAIRTPHFLFFSMTLFLAIAFMSATHDIAVDGFYMLSMDDKEQAFFVGIRSFFYRLAMLFSSGILVMWAGKIEKATGDIPLSWNLTLMAAAAIMLGLCLYHRWSLPLPDTDVRGGARLSRGEFAEIFLSYFRQDRIVLVVAFILLYRFGEAMLLKLAAPFLLDGIMAGGMGLSTGQVGLAYGTIGLASLITGGILGGWLISRFGLKRCIWPMAIALNAPDLVYVYMSYHQTLAPSFVYALVAVEQFGYGVGTTAFMFFLILASGEKHKTSHFAISTGIMALGMMLPGFISGKLQATVGYPLFFIIVCLATLPGMALIPFLGLKKQ